MATKKSQRIGIWIIAIVMGVGTLGAYFGIILANNNQADQAVDNQNLTKQLEEQQKKMALEQASKSKPLDGYSVEKFDQASVTELQKTTLKEGAGEAVITKDSKITMNYFGWLPDGTIFDSTNKSGVVTPYAGTDGNGSAVTGFVPGFTAGLIGMKQGEVRKLVIPAAEAYGPDGSPPLIAGNTPIAFVVEVVKIH
jgi:FKBP-type peptidyl-prolyl cis-trans isomerase